MDLVFTAVGWLSIPLLLGSAAFLVRQWHRDQRMTTWRLLQPVVLACVSLWFYVLVLGVPLGAITNWLPMVAGATVGVLVSRGEELRLERGEAVSTRTAWSYVVWASGLALSQGVTLLVPSSAGTGMAVVFATTGLTSGEHLGLLQRRYRLRHPRPVEGNCPDELMMDEDVAGAWTATLEAGGTRLVGVIALEGCSLFDLEAEAGS